MLDIALLLTALVAALALRPWQLLRNRKALVTQDHGDSAPL